MKPIIIALATAGLFAATASQADIRIDVRQINQQRQIDAGKRSGKLTVAERNLLTNEQRGIKRQKARFERGGFDKREKGVVNGLLDRAQAHIVRLKDNRVRTRGSRDI